MNITLLSKNEVDPFLEHRKRSANESGSKKTPLFTAINAIELKKSIKIQHWDGDPKKQEWRRNWGAWDSDEIIANFEAIGNGAGYDRHRVTVSVAVEEEYRQKGIGKAFLKEFIHWVSDYPFIEWVDISVFANNEPSITFFKRYGFEQVGYVKDKYRISEKQIDLLLMTKTVKELAQRIQ